MSPTLRSHLCGRWIDPAGDRVPLLNPTTEEVLAEVATGGADFASALAFARETGGAALRALTFAERGRLLAAMSAAIHAKRDELIDLSIANGGNTRGDAKFDLDGATGTLSYYAALGESIGAVKVLLDGDAIQLGRSPRLVGRHIQWPRDGAAVHINAFNFPAWGLAEKAALALLAGMPVVTKPATSTALLAARIVEILLEAKALPEGALSFIAGPVGDLLDHLTAQDVLAFTGSGETGAALRSRPNLVRDAIRVNVEADSLNAAVLGPDVEPDTDTWDLFVREVSKDVTQKAGQKCTAIRRVFVPASRLEAARDSLVDRVGEVRVGHPALSEVRMGPLATSAQLQNVKAGIERLKKCARTVMGDGGRGRLVGVEGDKGYFLSPTLFHAADAEGAAEVHAHEVFGPVATIMSYDGTAAQAVRLVRLGGGGLVSSVYTDDAGFGGAMLSGLAPYHGRLHFGSEKVAEHSPGPGTVLPQMVHGGPGRAGAGEELGGARGMAFYLQRTAIQGYPPLLEKMLGIEPAAPSPTSTDPR